MLNIIKKIGKFLFSRLFLIILLVVLLIAISILFWVYAPLISFNDVHLFGNTVIRGAVIFILWLSLFFIFLFKKVKDLFAHLHSHKRKKIQDLKDEAKEFFYKTKRNFSIAMNDAKDTWKRDIKTKDIPLIMVIGNEKAGKSSLINYAEIEYPITDTLASYKKHHLSTRNFTLYVSKDGALIDTEGSFFSIENDFKPQNTDELPEDDIDRNKSYLLKKIVWKSFLKFLNNAKFYKKLNGIVLVVDLYSLMNGTEEDSRNNIRYLVKRLSECENNLNIKLPFYVVFSKLDLVYGMGDFLKLYGESVSERALGITIPKQATVSVSYLKERFIDIALSLKHSLMSKNHINHSVADKEKSYLFLKQVENIFSIAIDFISRLNNENSFKNKSFLRGVYFTSAYQENVPRNFLTEVVCKKYDVKAPMGRPCEDIHKKSYFVNSLFKEIIFKDKGLSRPIFGSYWKKISTVAVALGIFGITYFSCMYFVNQRKANVAILEKSLNNIKTAILDIEVNYNSARIDKKSEYIQKLRNVLSDYPQLFGKIAYADYVRLNLAYKGMEPAKILYLHGLNDILSSSLTTELQNILKRETDEDNLIKALYMYKSLFDRSYLNKELLKIWVRNNWNSFGKYGISQNIFFTYIEDLPMDSLFPKITINDELVEHAREGLLRATRSQRLYSLLSFSAYDKSSNDFYSIRDSVGGPFEEILDTSVNSYSIPASYTISGIDNLLTNINEYIEHTANIESWLLGDKNLGESENNKTALSLDVIRLYLQEYQQQWQKVLENIRPKPFMSNDSGLNVLSIMSKSSNPLSGLIEVVSKNTSLMDNSLLTHAANLGFPTAEIKNNFMTISDAFGAYHEIAKQGSIFNKGIDAIGAKAGVKQDNQKVIDKISEDVKNVYKKIIDITSGTTGANDKILYALKRPDIGDDPFVALNADSALLPSELAAYYQKLNQYAWNLIELRAGIELDKAWSKEMYAPFMEEVAFLYPINSNAKDAIGFDVFKRFFGKQGVWNQFFKMYLDQILIKRGSAYSIDPGYASKLNFSDIFLSTVSKLAGISNGILDMNDNLNVNFSIKAVALSGDFGKLLIEYDSNFMQYDQTFSSDLGFIAGNFKNSTKLNVSVFDYQGNLKFTKEYPGEWGWLKFLQSAKPLSSGNYRIIFDNNPKLYFDFNINSGLESVMRVNNLLSGLALPQNILK